MAQIGLQRSPCIWRELGLGRGAAHLVHVCRQQSSLLCQEPCISLSLEDASAKLCVLSLQPSLSWLLLIDLWIN